MVREPTHASVLDRRVLVQVVFRLAIIPLLREIERLWLFIFEMA